MKTLAIITLLNAFVCGNQLIAQTPSEEAAPKGRLYGSIAVNLGFSDIHRYSPDHLYAFSAYLQRGKSVNLSFSLGGKNFGFNLDYINNRYEINIAQTIQENSEITELEVSGYGSKSFRTEGFLIGPYIIGNIDNKNKFRLILMPSIGLVSSTFPGLIIKYGTNGFSVTSGEVENRLTYAFGAKFSYTFWKQLAIGVMGRYSNLKTLYLDKIEPIDYGISLSWTFPL